MLLSQGLFLLSLVMFVHLLWGEFPPVDTFWYSIDPNSLIEVQPCPPFFTSIGMTPYITCADFSLKGPKKRQLC